MGFNPKNNTDVYPDTTGVPPVGHAGYIAVLQPNGLVRDSAKEFLANSSVVGIEQDPATKEVSYFIKHGAYKHGYRLYQETCEQRGTEGHEWDVYRQWSAQRRAGGKKDPFPFEWYSAKARNRRKHGMHTAPIALPTTTVVDELPQDGIDALARDIVKEESKVRSAARKKAEKALKKVK